MRPTRLDLTDDERRVGQVALVLLLGGLDEVLLATPALRALARTLPGHRLVVAGHPAVGAAAVGWGLADGWLPARAWHLPRLPAPDVAVNMTDAGPQSHRLVMQLRPRRLVAVANPQLGVDGPRWELWTGEGPAIEHRRARWCRMVAAELDVDVDTRDGLIPGLARSLDAAPSTDVLIHPGGPVDRRWPASRFADVARALSGAHRVRVVATLGEGDLVDSVVAAAGLPPTAGWVAQDAAELGRAVAGARLVVAGDTVVGHLAGASAVPGVHLHGTTSAAERGPLRVARQSRTVSAVGPAAMSGISVAQVLAAVDDLARGSDIGAYDGREATV